MTRQILKKFYAVAFCKGLAFSFFFATYTLFLRDAGLDLFQINLINAVYMFGVFVLEIPTGAFADLMGRKRSFVFSCLLLCLSFFVYFFSRSFLWFIVAELIGAMGTTFASGAFDAWMFDSVKKHDDNYDTRDVFIRFNQINQFGIIFGSVIGAYIGAINIALPWLMSGFGLLLLGIYAETRMDEHRIEKTIETKKLKFRKIIKESITICKAEKQVQLITFLAFIFTFSCMASNMFWPVRFKEQLGIPQEHLGWIFALIVIVIAIGSQAAKRFINWARDEIGAILMSFSLFAVGMVGAAWGGTIMVALPFYLVHQFSRGVYEPIKQNYTNERIPSETRATVLSLQNMIEGMAAFLGLVISGFVSEHFGIEKTWLATSMVMALPVAIYLLLKRKLKVFVK